MIEWANFDLASLFRRYSTLKAAYSTVFNNTEATGPVREIAQDLVMRDLARYCHAMSPTKDDREQGRRDVWLYLGKFLRLSEDELTILYSGAGPEIRYQMHSPGATYLTDKENV